MGIRFACHVCHKKLNIKRELAGRRGICPACSAKFRIPMDDTEMSSPVETVRRVTVSEHATSTQAETPEALTAPSFADPDSMLLSDDEPEATWYVRPPSGGQYGPASSEVLKQWVAEGRVAATALLWRDGWPQWRDADKVLPELAHQLPGAKSIGSSRDGSPMASVSASQAEMSADAGVLERPQSRQRILLIGILSALSVLLIGIIALVMNR